MALVSTVGGINSNSYVTVTEANAYFNDRINSSTWTSYQGQDKLLVTASLTIDFYMTWDGDKTSIDQSMEWPRINVVDILDSVIPTRIKHAVYELAIYLIDKGVSYDNSDLDSIKVGPLTIDFNEKENGFLLPDHISRMLSYFGSAKTLVKRGIGQPRLIRT